MSAWQVPGYREIRELGVGGAGRVVLAMYTTTGAYVAIKYLRDELRQDFRFLHEFRREARVMVEFNDPNIVRLYEYYETPQGAAIVMELVDGAPLRRILAEHGTTSPEAALVVLKGSLIGLSLAHTSGIVHRDYKPENVLIQADGSSKLSDFGIATPSGDPGVPAGTPPYMAPEQWDTAVASPATDVYAATCVFFECLTGRKPYQADHLAGLRHLHKNAPIPLMEVPASVRELVARGLAKDPRDRPPTARAFMGDLESAAISAYGPDWEQRGRRHLAELATLLALLFPLAKPARTPEVSSSLAKSVLRSRLAHFAPRFAIGAGVLTAVAVAALVAANRPTPVADDSLIPPPQTQTQQAEVPAFDNPPQPPAPSDSPTPSPADSPTPTPTPSGGASTPPAPPPSTPPTTPPVLQVSGLSVAAFDGQSATIRVRATTTQRVTLGVRFSEGSSPGSLVPSAPQNIPLQGALSYNPGVQHAFPTPKCGTTVFRRIEVATAPAAIGGVESRTVRVRGPVCPPPAVKSATITAWTGKTATVAITTDGTGRLSATATFSRDGKQVSSAGRSLSGKTSYSLRLSGDLGAVPCEQTAVFSVRLTTDPAAANGPQTKETRVTGPKCPAPQVAISSWNGSTLVASVRTQSAAAVELAAKFVQTLTFQGRTLVFDNSQSGTVQGAGTHTFNVQFKQPSCGFTDVRTATVTASPGGDSASQTVTVDGPPCPEPEDDPTTPGTPG